MSETETSPAESRFARRLEETGARDPREFYRGLLRDLKEADLEGYEEMVASYRTDVVTPIEDDEGDPLVLWLAFGARVAGRLHPGRAVVVGEDGQATPFAPPPDHRQLLLHLPDDVKTRAIPVGIPADPTPAQAATLDLLVRGRTRLPESA